jgi:hypothetical protein
MRYRQKQCATLVCKKIWLEALTSVGLYQQVGCNSSLREVASAPFSRCRDYLRPSFSAANPAASRSAPEGAPLAAGVTLIRSHFGGAGVFGAGVFGAGVFGAGVFGAGVFGAGVFGAGVFGAGGSAAELFEPASDVILI